MLPCPRGTLANVIHKENIVKGIFFFSLDVMDRCYIVILLLKTVFS
jgi:hypothetical protein